MALVGTHATPLHENPSAPAHWQASIMSDQQQQHAVAAFTAAAALQSVQSFPGAGQMGQMPFPASTYGVPAGELRQTVTQGGAGSHFVLTDRMGLPAPPVLFSEGSSTSGMVRTVPAAGAAGTQPPSSAAVAPSTSGSAAGGAAASGSKPKSVAAFVGTTWEIMSNTDLDSMITWTNNGSKFLVLKPDEFARDILPLYFKHANFSSFVRQLNSYGFRKTHPEKWEFHHTSFLRGREELLLNIRRGGVSGTAKLRSTPKHKDPAVVAVDPQRDAQLQAEADSLRRDNRLLRATVDHLRRGNEEQSKVVAAKENELAVTRNQQGNMEDMVMKLTGLLSSMHPHWQQQIEGVDPATLAAPLAALGSGDMPFPTAEQVAMAMEATKSLKFGPGGVPAPTPQPKPELDVDTLLPIPKAKRPCVEHVEVPNCGTFDFMAGNSGFGMEMYDDYTTFDYELDLANKEPGTVEDIAFMF